MAINIEEFKTMVRLQFTWLEKEFNYKYIRTVTVSSSYFISIYFNGALVVRIIIDDFESRTTAEIIKINDLSYMDDNDAFQFDYRQTLSVRFFCTLINNQYKFPHSYQPYSLSYLVDLSEDVYRYCKYIIDGSIWMNNKAAAELLKLSENFSHRNKI